MKPAWLFTATIIAALVLSACGFTPPPLPPTLSITISPNPTSTSIPKKTPIVVNAATPCVGAPPPAQWHHIIVLIFENKNYDQVIGPARYITSLAHKCATAANWKDADTKVDGLADGEYNSKPSYATLTTGLSPSVHGLIDDTYNATTNADNIYNQLNITGDSFKDYYEGQAGGCGVEFSGDYHDPIRYFTNVTAICNIHDVPLSTFMSDVNNGNLPVFSMLIPTNHHNMHDNSVASGDVYAQNMLDPLLNSQAYAKGDVAIFFLWDEGKDQGSSVPNILLAPSIVAGSKITILNGNPISHFSALRTWEEMLGLPLLGDTKLAPNLLPIFNGKPLE